jgi:hypothetical protein
MRFKADIGLAEGRLIRPPPTLNRCAAAQATVARAHKAPPGAIIDRVASRAVTYNLKRPCLP